MTKRKNDGLLDVLAQLPWWVSVVFAGVVYVTLKYILPSQSFAGLLVKGLVSGGQQAAGYFALPFLFVAVLPAINQARRKRLLGLGSGFAFSGRQVRLTLEGDHFYALIPHNAIAENMTLGGLAKQFGYQ